MRTEMSKVKPEGTSLPEKMVLYGLLLREEFRQMLLHTEYGSDYFTDDDTYVDIPESVGIFRTGARWKVYETDERGAAVLKREYDNPAEAFRDAAVRRELSFTPGEVAQSVLHDSLSREQLSKQLRAVRLAIQHLKTVDQLMCLTENPDAVKEDIRILENIEEHIETSLNGTDSDDSSVVFILPDSIRSSSSIANYCCRSIIDFGSSTIEINPDTSMMVQSLDTAAITLTKDISSLITWTRAKGEIQRAQLKMLENQTRRVIADARVHHLGKIAMESLEQIAKTQELIDNLENRGLLHGISLDMAMAQLDDLNNTLRRNLQSYIDRQ